jgi:hypothetical protein
MEDTKKLLSKEFEMLDLGSFHFCLGMEILYNKELGILSIDQQIYIEENVFQRYNMQSYNSTIMPMEVELKLNKKRFTSN